MWIWLFILGCSFGSFINVIALRYDPDRFLLNPKVIGGRSHCPQCGKTLRWYELLPLISFLLQFGRCRSCKTKISPRYPTVEVVSGLIFVSVPYRLQFLASGGLKIPESYDGAVNMLWIAVFLTLLLIFLIDMRTQLIPDEANIFLALLGVVLFIINYSGFDIIQDSFLGSYALLLGSGMHIARHYFLGVLFGLGFFGFLILVTKGRGMGMGDMKLAGALGILFGFADLAVIVGLSFILGGMFGAATIVLKRKKMKSFLPFGPFLAIGAAVVFFFGFSIIEFYFKLFNFI
ncbi:MAG: prepilin peptidase [Patescibacteria group bacterium]